MTDLNIPDGADDLWFECGCRDETCNREGYQKPALPLVVAAAYRGIADELEQGSFAASSSSPATAAVADGVLVAVVLLRYRADQLDSSGAQSDASDPSRGQS